MIADVPTDDVSEPLTMSPDVLVQGTTVGGVLLSAEEPLFANPDTVVSLGAGIVITDVVILDDFTASLDVVVSPRAVLEGRAVVTESDITRMSTFEIIGPGNAPDNKPPVVKIETPLPPTLEGDPFEVAVSFDDSDGDFVEIFLAIKDVNTDQIIYRSDRKVYDTGVSDPGPEKIVFEVPGFPVGPYEVIVETDDGIAFFVLSEEEFFVAPGSDAADSK